MCSNELTHWQTLLQDLKRNAGFWIKQVTIPFLSCVAYFNNFRLFLKHFPSHFRVAAFRFCSSGNVAFEKGRLFFEKIKKIFFVGSQRQVKCTYLLFWDVVANFGGLRLSRLGVHLTFKCVLLGDAFGPSAQPQPRLKSNTNLLDFCYRERLLIWYISRTA